MHAATTPNAASANASPAAGPSTPSTTDPYAKLTPQAREQLEREVRNIEEYYGHLMREAMKLPEPRREEELGKLKNRYNTKQSNTRKKYGVRLRERRSVADIEAEKTRLFGPSTGDVDEQAHKRARTGDGRQDITTPSANTGQADSPRRRVPLKDMGGLSGSSATAELQDPTAAFTSSQPLGAPLKATQTTNAITTPGVPFSTPQAGMPGSSNDPMQIDDDSSSEDGAGAGSDGDIPAQIPVAAV